KKEYPEFEVPDVVNTLFEYPGLTYNVSLTLNCAAEGFGALFMGTKGAIQVDEVKMLFFQENPGDDNGWVVSAWPQKLQDEYVKEKGITGINQPYPRGACTAPLAYEHYDVIGDPTDLHVKAFVESVRSRKPTKETAVEGHNAALGAHIANMSYRNGSRKVLWDGKAAKLA
ncbi:MAG TPA: hypothetical protein VFM21_05200, partial [Terriglobia bacterium]|nr:hypothetical protein [Terriglobia bacterium]